MVIVRDTFHDFGKPMGKKLTRAKAKEILRHGKVHGKKLSKKQRGFFGARAHNPQPPYGDNAAKASSAGTPSYKSGGRMGKLSS